jgi:hypothetical protein
MKFENALHNCSLCYYFKIVFSLLMGLSFGYDICLDVT